MDQEPADKCATDVDSILKCLADHVHGRGELSATQIRAAEILLRRAPQGDAPEPGPPEREPVTQVRNVLVRPRG